MYRSHFYFILTQEVPEVKVPKTTRSQLVPCVIRNFRAASYLVAAAATRSVIKASRTLTWLVATNVQQKTVSSFRHWRLYWENVAAGLLRSCDRAASWHVTVHRNKFLYNKTNRRTNFPNLSWLKMILYMFRAVPLPIIRSSLTLHLALVYVIRFVDSFRAGPGRPCSEAVYKPYDIYQCQV